MQTDNHQAKLNAFRMPTRTPSPLSPTFQFPAPSSQSAGNLSMTPSASIPLMNNSASVMSSPPSPIRASSSSSSSRPLSHHRRKSSVSTRRESNEIMGVVTTPEEDEQASRDEVRKRALLALEGARPVITGFAKVEIPDWETPTHEKSFDWDFPKSSLSNPLAGKRDSFGRSLVTPSVSVKAELGTLVEEDEEEDEDGAPSSSRPTSTPSLLPIPTTRIIRSSPMKTRPASLSLRTLSLVGDLPTPTATPSPRSGMRPFSFSPSPSSSVFSVSSTSSGHFAPSSPTTAAVRRRSQMASKRSSPSTDLSVLLESTRAAAEAAGEPLTPTSTRTPSVSSASSSSRLSVSLSERSMSPTEAFAQQAYALQNHASLLARIADLEDALSSAHAKSSASTASNDELIALVADVKVERDALHVQAEQQRGKIQELVRNGDLTNKRLESARAEAWVEKDKAETMRCEMGVLKAELTDVKEALAREKEARAREVNVLEARVAKLQKELAHATLTMSSRRFMSSVDSSVTAVDSEASPFGSLSSLEAVGVFKGPQTELAVVAEEEEHDDHDNNNDFDDEEEDTSTELASYEEEDEYMDLVEATYGGEDDDSEDEYLGYEPPSATVSSTQSSAPFAFPAPAPFTFPVSEPVPAPVPAPVSAPAALHPPTSPPHGRAPSHSHRASLVTQWRFPRGSDALAGKPKPKEKVDHFFIGLGDSDDENDEKSAELLGVVMAKKPSPTRVVVTPDLAATFALNFVDEDEDDFTFEAKVGDQTMKVTPVPASVEPSASKPLPPVQNLAPVPVPTRAPIPPSQPMSPCSFAPPPMVHSSQMGGKIVPLVAAPQPAALKQNALSPISSPLLSSSTIPSTSNTTTTRVQIPRAAVTQQPQSRPRLAPPPPSFMPTPETPPRSRSAALKTLDESFSYAKTPAPKSAGANVIAFPTTSASPFSLPSMRLSLSSFSNLMPLSWTGGLASPRGTTTTFAESSSSSFARDVERPGSPTPTTVNRDVMRERLRARLVQEGKIAGPSSGR